MTCATSSARSRARGGGRRPRAAGRAALGRVLRARPHALCGRDRRASRRPGSASAAGACCSTTCTARPSAAASAASRRRSTRTPAPTSRRRARSTRCSSTWTEPARPLLRHRPLRLRRRRSARAPAQARRARQPRALQGRRSRPARAPARRGQGTRGRLGGGVFCALGNGARTSTSACGSCSRRGLRRLDRGRAGPRARPRRAVRRVLEAAEHNRAGCASAASDPLATGAAPPGQSATRGPSAATRAARAPRAAPRRRPTGRAASGTGPPRIAAASASICRASASSSTSSVGRQHLAHAVLLAHQQRPGAVRLADQRAVLADDLAAHDVGMRGAAGEVESTGWPAASTSSPASDSTSPTAAICCRVGAPRANASTTGEPHSQAARSHSCTPQSSSIPPLTAGSQNAARRRLRHPTARGAACAARRSLPRRADGAPRGRARHVGARSRRASASPRRSASAARRRSACGSNVRGFSHSTCLPAASAAATSASCSGVGAAIRTAWTSSRASVCAKSLSTGTPACAPSAAAAGAGSQIARSSTRLARGRARRCVAPMRPAPIRARPVLRAYASDGARGISYAALATFQGGTVGRACASD